MSGNTESDARGAPSVTAARVDTRSLRGILARLGRFEQLGVLAGLVGTIVIFSLLSPYFFTVSNLGLLSRLASLFGIMVVGMTFVMIAGEIDLSVGSIFGLTSVLAAVYLRDVGTNIWVAVLLGIATGLLCGFLNGALSVVTRVPSIIITIGTLSIYRGINWYITRMWSVEDFDKTSAFFTYGIGKLFGAIPYIFIALLIVAVVGWFVLSRTVFGLHVFATGTNPNAAVFAGVNTKLVKLAVLTLNGFLAGLAGMWALSITGIGDPNGGSGYELDIIAACIVGGTRLGGGAGSVLGSLIGAFIISGILRNGLILIGVTTSGQIIATGVIVVAAVALDTLVRRKSA